MRFIDQVVIQVQAGRGGSGCMSFRRETYVPRGGPDGGDGGRGGDVVLIADPNLTTLLDLHYHREYKAQPGKHGEGQQRTGRSGEDYELKVPAGTIVVDVETDEVLGDLVDPGQRLVVATGGRGGRGNLRFKTSRNQAPRRTDPGEDGQGRQLRLELKLLADVGLVGFPNAGKSTLLSTVTTARPKIADYPFTTLTPNLGIVKLAAYRSCTMADIPGLIEGASEGKGLGHAFLRHVERTRVLVFLLDVTDEPQARYDALLRELSAHAENLLAAQRIVCLSKMDLWPPDEPLPGLDGVEPLRLSAVTGVGVEELKQRIAAALAV